jgi:peptide/nickel transport system ATP-binding protein
MFITHDLATVRSIAEEAVAMQKGRAVEQGPKNEMFKPPHHPYADLLLSSVPEMDPNWLTTTLLEERGVDNVGNAASLSFAAESRETSSDRNTVDLTKVRGGGRAHICMEVGMVIA